MSRVIELVSPVPAAAATRNDLVAKLDTLSGKTIGFRIQWNNFAVFVDRLEQLLVEAEGIAGSKRWNLLRAEREPFGGASTKDIARRHLELEEFAVGLDAVVVGLAA